MQATWLSTTECLYHGLSEDSGIFPRPMYNISLVWIVSYLYFFTFSFDWSLFKTSFAYQIFIPSLPWEFKEFIVPTAFQRLQYLSMDALFLPQSTAEFFHFLTLWNTFPEQLCQDLIHTDLCELKNCWWHTMTFQYFCFLSNLAKLKSGSGFMQSHKHRLK